MRSLVVGVGDWERGDDAAALEVARRVADAAVPGVAVICHEGAALDLLETWPGYDRVVLVCPAGPDVEAGRVVPIAPDGTDGPTAIADALRYAVGTGRLPPRFQAFGIGTAHVGAGAPLSRPVAHAARMLADRIRSALVSGASLVIDETGFWTATPKAATSAVWGTSGADAGSVADRGYVADTGYVAAVEAAVRLEEGAEACAAFVTGEAAVRGASHASRAGLPRVVAVLDAASRALRTLTAHGADLRRVPGDDPAAVAAAIEDGVDQLWLTSPMGPRGYVLDVARFARQAADQGAITIVDVTDGSAVPRRPLALGADLVVHAGVGALGGTCALHGGFVAGEAELMGAVTAERERTDARMRPATAERLHDGLRSWPLRAERRSANALAVARYLQRHPHVHDVRYPGLARLPHPERLLACGADGYGPTLSFVLGATGNGAAAGTAARADFVGRLRRARVEDGGETAADGVATAVGGVVVPNDEDRVRLTLGIEDIDDLLDDLEAALTGR